MMEEYSNEVVEVGDKGDLVWSDYNKWVVIGSRVSPPKNSRLRSLHKMHKKRTTRPRLYAIAQGKGGLPTCGLY